MKYFRFLIIVFSTSIFCNISLLFAVEKGDLIFRELAMWQDIPFVEFAGHTGIYWEYVGGNPDDMTNHRVIESLDTIGVWVNTLKGFHDTSQYLGAFSLNPTKTQRNEIIYLALSQISKPYNFTSGYKGPDTFRCDGLAEYCYESFGLDIVQNDNWLTIWPKLQLYYMTFAVSQLPQITINDSDQSTIPDGGITGKANISIYTSDDSGIFLTELWRKDPNAGGSLVKSFPENYYYDHFYSSTDIGVLTDGVYYIRCYDQAGNCSEHHFTVAVKDTDDDGDPDITDADDDNDGIPDEKDPFAWSVNDSNNNGVDDAIDAEIESRKPIYVRLRGGGVSSSRTYGDSSYAGASYPVTAWGQQASGGGLNSGTCDMPMSVNSGISLTASCIGGYTGSVSASFGNGKGKWMGKDMPVLGSIGVGAAAFQGNVCVWTGSAGITYKHSFLWHNSDIDSKIYFS